MTYEYLTIIPDIISYDKLTYSRVRKYYTSNPYQITSRKTTIPLSKPLKILSNEYICSINFIHALDYWDELRIYLII